MPNTADTLTARCSAVAAALSASDMPCGVELVTNLDAFATTLANTRSATAVFRFTAPDGAAPTVRLFVALPMSSGGLLTSVGVEDVGPVLVWTARRLAALVSAVADLAVTLENAG